MGDAPARSRVWLEEVRPATLLVPAIAIQWLTTLGLALTVRHNGWLFYQGGDQLWYYDSGWLLAHGQIPLAFVGNGWPALLAPIAALGGPTLVPALPAIVLFNVLVLGAGGAALHLRNRQADRRQGLRVLGRRSCGSRCRSSASSSPTTSTTSATPS